MFIYVVTNTVNGKQYVGQTTVPIQKRWQRHCAAARGARPDCRVFHAAIRKYGPTSFLIETILLKNGASQTDLDARERETIIALGTIAPNGYNLKEGGLGGALHADTKAKLSASLRGRRFSAGHRAKISAALKGRTFSSETLARMSNGQRGRKHSPETLHRLSESHRGIISPNKGKSPSAETRLKLSLAGIGRIVSEATRTKLSAATRNHYAAKNAS